MNKNKRKIKISKKLKMIKIKVINLNRIVDKKVKKNKKSQKVN